MTDRSFSMPRMMLTLLALMLAAPGAADYREIEWLDLMPAEEAEAWLNDQSDIDHFGGMVVDPFQSFKTVPEMDGRKIRIPGFVVPVETTESGQLKEFFLVPYFGACIHLPPPPANQIIYGRLEQPIDMINIWDAFWMEGTLKVEDVSNEMADAAYTMDVESLTVY